MTIFFLSVDPVTENNPVSPCCRADIKEIKVEEYICIKCKKKVTHAAETIDENQTLGSS